MIVRLYRIGALALLALCSAMIWTPAHASFPPTYGTLYGAQSYVTGNFFPATNSTIAAACAVAAAQVANGYNVTSVVPGANGALTCIFTTTTSSWTGGVTTAQGNSCPANSTLSGGQCTCTAPNVQNAANNGCQAPPAVCEWAAGQPLGKSTTSSTAEIPKGSTAVCMYGCRWNVTVSPDFWWKDAAGVYQGHAETGTLIGTGGACTGTEGANGDGGPASPTPPIDPEPFPKPPCAAGYIPGTVTANGVTTTLCQPAINTENVKEKVKQEDTPEGPKSTTTSETTVCNVAGSCTTTTTTSVSINGGPPTTTTTSETQGKQAYCATGTGKKECGTGSGSWQGDCKAGFVGEGDPVTVAMAKEIHVQNCLMNKVTDESALYDAAKVKTGDQTGELPGNETKAITSADIDQTNAIVGGTCIADRTININLIVTTSTLVLPFSSICPLLDYFRLVLIALGFFIAYRIIGGR